MNTALPPEPSPAPKRANPDHSVKLAELEYLLTQARAEIAKIQAILAKHGIGG